MEISGSESVAGEPIGAVVQLFDHDVNDLAFFFDISVGLQQLRVSGG